VAWIQKETQGNPDVHILVSPWVLHVAVGRPATAWQKFQVIDFCAKMLQRAAERTPLEADPARQAQMQQGRLPPGD
jgi:hypothetical protein